MQNSLFSFIIPGYIIDKKFGNALIIYQKRILLNKNNVLLIKKTPHSGRTGEEF